jgi:hypothetical protein
MEVSRRSRGCYPQITPCSTAWGESCAGYSSEANPRHSGGSHGCGWPPPPRGPGASIKSARSPVWSRFFCSNHPTAGHWGAPVVAHEEGERHWSNTKPTFLFCCCLAAAEEEYGRGRPPGWGAPVVVHEEGRRLWDPNRNTDHQHSASAAAECWLLGSLVRVSGRSPLSYTSTELWSTPLPPAKTIQPQWRPPPQLHLPRGTLGRPGATGHPRGTTDTKRGQGGSWGPSWPHCSAEPLCRTPLPGPLLATLLCRTPPGPLLATLLCRTPSAGTLIAGPPGPPGALVARRRWSTGTPPGQAAALAPVHPPLREEARGVTPLSAGLGGVLVD